MSLAHGGQVLVSDAAEVLLRSRVALRPLGEHRLRGLRGRMSVYQVVADGLPAEFPDAAKRRLLRRESPRQLSSLVGREDVVAEIAELVGSGRLVTLSGVGGVGKTRLAIEVGAEVAGEFPDGVWMVELAAVGDPASVRRASRPCWASRRRATGPHRHGGRCARRSAAALVVDNCEHVGAAAGIGHRDDPRAVWGREILATSREALGVAGETVLTVAPLDLEGGVTSDAVTLFVERARPSGPTSGSRTRRPRRR